MQFVFLSSVGYTTIVIKIDLFSCPELDLRRLNCCVCDYVICPHSRTKGNGNELMIKKQQSFNLVYQESIMTSAVHVI